MADFRKSLLLAAVAFVGIVGTASAQTCAGTVGAPPELRSEGQTELTGAIVLNCTGLLTPTTVNLDVTLNNGTVPITSPAGEAVVQVGAAAPVAGTEVSLTSGGFANDVRFTGIAIPAGNVNITISGIRANVNPTYVPLNSGGFGQVLAVISVSNGTLPINQVNNGFFVGIVLPGLGAVTVNSVTVSSCGAGSVSLGAGVNFTVNVPELFPTVFKIQGPNGVADSESGPTNPTNFVASSGTQLAVTFANIPTGVTFYLPATITSTASGTAVLVATPGSTVAIVSGLVDPTGGTNYAYYPAASGTTYYYNVTATNPSVSESFTIPFYNTSITLSSSFATTVSVSLAPIATAADPPIPTTNLVPTFFGGGSTASLTTSAAQGCQTSLLFPFLTNQAGFDTGVSIDASGTDPFNTNVAGGTCTWYFYGANPPATPPVLTIPSGGEGHATISSVAPNFQGYGIAVCNFTYAHGYAFLSDGFMGGGRGLSEGYVALVINDRVGASVSPEVLGH
jgi:hypothetical protein